MIRGYKGLRLFLLDSDDALAADAAGLVDAALDITHSPPDAGLAALHRDMAGTDAVIVSLDCGGEGLLDRVVRMAGARPVIAIAGRGSDGHSLEHTLLRAEMRGARLALPKPIGASELVLAVLDVLPAGAPGDDRRRALAGALQRRAAW